MGVQRPRKKKSGEEVDEESGGETLCCGVLEKDEEDADFGCVVGPCLLSLLIVVCGTASTVTSKIMYEVRSHGTASCPLHDDDDGDDDATTHRCKFTKPWFQTLVMKLAMSLCYVVHKASRWYRKRQWQHSSSSGQQRRRETKPRPVVMTRDDDLAEPLMMYEDDSVTDDDSPSATKTLTFDEKFPTPAFDAVLFIAYPALTDLVQTVLAQAGLLWVTSSVYQMVRASFREGCCLFAFARCLVESRRRRRRRRSTREFFSFGKFCEKRCVLIRCAAASSYSLASCRFGSRGRR